MAFDIPGMVVHLIGEAETLLAAYGQGSAAAEAFAGTVAASSAQVAGSSGAMDAAVAATGQAMMVNGELVMATNISEADSYAVLAAMVDSSVGAQEAALATLDGALGSVGAAGAVAAGGEEAVAAGAATASVAEEGMTAATGGLGASLGVLMGPITIVLAALAATIGVALSLVSTYSSLEKQTKLLEAASSAAGISAADVEQQLQSNASAYAQYGVSVSQARSAVTTLIQANLTEAQAFAALPAVMDLAAAKGMSVSDAAERYAKSVAGGGRALLDLGIQITKVKGDMTDYGAAMLSPAQMTERLNTLNSALTGQLGNAANSANDMEKASANLANAWDRLSNMVGPAVLTILSAVANVLTLLVHGFEVIVGAVERVVSVLTHLDGSADTAASSLDSATQAADTATSGLNGLSNTATSTGTSMTGLASSTSAAMGTTRAAVWGAAYEAAGAISSILAGYDALGNKIMMTIPDFLAFQQASRAAADSAAQDIVTMQQAAGLAASAAMAGNFGASYTGSAGMVFSSTNAAYGYNTTTGQPNRPPPGQTPGAGPGRAGGGSVAPGQPYTVGENGPEIFVPGVGGSIQPGGGGGGGKPGVAITVNNPKPESASTSIKRELQKLATMGFLEPAR